MGRPDHRTTARALSRAVASGTEAAVVLRVAMFPRGLDGLFLPQHPGGDVLALIQRGSPEEAWAERFLVPSQRLLYDLAGELGPYPATDEILRRSDIHRVMKARRVPALLLSAACTPATKGWAEHHGVQL